MLISFTIFITVQHSQIERPSYDAFFDDPRTLTYNIIAIQESWRNLQFWTTYHHHKNVFHLIYMEHASTQIIFYINKKLTISSWNASHHSPDLCNIQLEIPSISKLHIHNIYNPISSICSPLRRLPMFQEKLAALLLDEHIILDDFNLHHLV